MNEEDEPSKQLSILFVFRKKQSGIKYSLFKFDFRYRGYNLGRQSDIMKPGSVEYVYFDTDFGVQFGIFTCLDLIFTDPAIVLNRAYNIHHFVYSAAWSSRTPFLTGLFFLIAPTDLFNCNFLY